MQTSKHYQNFIYNSFSYELSEYSIKIFEGRLKPLNTGISTDEVLDPFGYEVPFRAVYNISDVFSPRMGFSFGGSQGFIFSLGLGVEAGPVIIDVGTYNLSGIYNPNITSQLSGAFSIKFKIN